MVCTNDSRLARRVRQLTTPDLLPRYEVRYNYKMSDLTAGLALSQFRRLEGFVERRRNLAAQYTTAVAGSSLRLQQRVEGAEPSFYRFVVRTRRPAALIRLAATRGITCDRPVFRPLHRYLSGLGNAEFSNTEAVWRSAVSVPLYPDLTEEESGRISDFLIEARQCL